MTEAPSSAPILELRGVSAAYGPFRALFGVSFAVCREEAVALVGPNGAGKTTVARVASGLLRPTAGSVLVGGVDMTGAPAHRFARAGVAHAPEGRAVFATLTVEENLALAFRRVRGRRGVRSGLEQAYEMFPVLRERRWQPAGTLSGGEQRMLAMARVMVERPSLLVADELSLGLAPIVVESVYETLAGLHREGTALLIVEQQISYAFALCDRVVLLDHGVVSWTGSADEAVGVAGDVFDPAHRSR
jgi:branched-chain amino acid transport system ATP-binding protein